MTLAHRVSIAVSVGLMTIVSGALANSTATYVTNRTAKTFQVWQSNLDYGAWDTFPAGALGIGGQTNWKSKTNKFMQGTEGWLTLASVDGRNLIRFYWDNPFIGSNSYHVDSSPDLEVILTSGGGGDDATVFYEIRSATTEYRVLSLPTTGPGTISGSVRWETAVGLPDPAYNKSDSWQAIAIQALAPSRFRTPFLATAAPIPNESQWNGMRGSFDGVQPAGQVACRPAASLPPGYYGFDYTISNLPVTLPLQLELKIVDSVPWPTDAGNMPPVGLLYPKYVRGLVAMRGTDAVLASEAPASSGMDFTVVGVWGSDPPNGQGQGGVTVDPEGLIQRAKTVSVNPNPVLSVGNLRTRVPRRGDTVLLEKQDRAWLQGLILAAPAVDLQKARVKQYSR